MGTCSPFSTVRDCPDRASNHPATRPDRQAQPRGTGSGRCCAWPTSRTHQGRCRQHDSWRCRRGWEIRWWGSAHRRTEQGEGVHPQLTGSMGDSQSYHRRRSFQQPLLWRQPRVTFLLPSSCDGRQPDVGTDDTDEKSSGGTRSRGSQQSLDARRRVARYHTQRDGRLWRVARQSGYMDGTTALPRSAAETPARCYSRKDRDGRSG